jgi:isoleucyl-tRNA synthetase
MYTRARPEDNILFGWHAADESRRQLLVLWNVYRHFVTYARLVGWQPGDAPAPEARPAMDRWILSRLAGLSSSVGERLADYDAVAATRVIETFIDDLSTWYLRLSRRRFSRNPDAADRAAAFATLRAALMGLSQVLAPILPFLADSMYENLAGQTAGSAAGDDSVHLTRWPTAELSGFRDERLESAMATARGAVDLARNLRSTAGLKVRQPLSRMWLALPGGDLPERDALLALIKAEVNVKAIELIGDESALVERRVKPLLPRIGKRLGPTVQAVLAAARAGEFEVGPDGSVTLAGVTLAPDEVEIQASPRPGTAVAHHDGLVVVIDTELTPDLVAEGDARDLQRAIQDLRREAGLELDDRIELWLDGVPDSLAPHLSEVADEVLAATTSTGQPQGDGFATDRLELGGAAVAIALRVASAAPGSGIGAAAPTGTGAGGPRGS